MKNSKMLTIQILVNNNEKTIKNTLDSIASIDAKTIVGDLGCSDRTVEICSAYGADIIKISNRDNYSKIRNSLCKEGINFYINPWEELIQGQEIINSIKDCSNIYLFQNNVISKEIRFWKEEKFINPVFETIINNNAKSYPQIVISSKNKPDEFENKLKLVEKWMSERPVDVEPYYYLACCYLSDRQYDKFLFYSQEYCSRENKVSSSFIMMKYYMAQVKLYMNKVKEAAELALTCISYHPANAEFWCLLGDIYYRQKIWAKSKCFYENAIILGSKRKNDDIPIEIEKYKEYPEKIIENIENILKNQKLFSG